MKTRTTKNLLSILPYALSFIAIAALVFVGTLRKVGSTGNLPILSTIREGNFTVSANQYDETYIVASIADTFSLPSAPVNTDNYFSVLSAYQFNQVADAPTIEKPTLIDTSTMSRGIVPYVVKDGDTIDTIAHSHSLTTEDIRWSNGMKNGNLTVGATIYLPPSRGIIYTVKAGETVDAIAGKYGSPAEEIRIYNDLEHSEPATGATIFLPSGTLPEKERPEYVAPTPRPSYGGGYAGVLGGGNTYARGYCTWYAAQWRINNGNPIPNRWGNAATWLGNARYAGYGTGSTPRAGAIFHTYAGYYGHVGIVEAVHGDGSITISDMNGIAGWNRVGRATISAAEARKYSYIY